MKQIIYAVILLGSFFFSQGLLAQAQKQKIEMTIDEIGDANLVVSMTMDASQWQVWLATTGNNPAALKRSLERAMPGYFLDDFTLDKDDMNRSFTMKMKAYGVCDIDKRGTWEVGLDQKNSQVTELDDHKFMLVNSPQEYGGSLQQTTIINLPENAKQIKTDTDVYGSDVITFKMNKPTLLGFSNLALVLGVLLLISGAGVFLKNRGASKS